MKKLFSILLILVLLFSTQMSSASEDTIPDILMLVNVQNPLPDDFQTSDLVNLYEMRHHFRLSRSDLYLERIAYEAADDMFAQAESENVNGFIMTSCYRSYEKQQEVYNNNPEGIAQLPGSSEHETGLAFDVTAHNDGTGFQVTPQFEWLAEHCWDYGFILRYPEGKEYITGINYEPWHYRYVGVEAAQTIHENDWTLEEYIWSLQDELVIY